MAARTCGNENQAVHAGFNRFFCMARVNHIVQHNPAVSVCAVHQFFRRRLQAGDKNRYLMFQTHGNVLSQTRVRRMHDLVHGKWRGITASRTIRCQLGFDVGQPRVQCAVTACIERRKRTYDTRFALLDNQLGIGYDEHWGANNWQTQVLQ